MSSRLQDALESLHGLERRADRLGLEGTARLLDALGNPHERFRSVHVGGTNGKGSTCSLVERVLRAAGVRTGLFTSPHLVDFPERIRVAGRCAAVDGLERLLARIQELPAGRDRTFFEVATALGFATFAAGDVAWGVVEVGLGGRLDCTNVLAPRLAVVTGVGLDHTEILGPTLEAVAREKAGIVKPGVPVVSGAMPPAAAAVIEGAARERGAPHVRAAERVVVRDRVLGPAGTRLAVAAPPWGRLDLELALRGRHQLGNALCALAALSVLAETEATIPAGAVVEGFSRTRWPGRLEPCPGEPRLWWDAAHNADGMEALARAWTEDLGFEPPAAVVLAASRDKDLGAMLDALRLLAGNGRLIATAAGNRRAVPPATLAGLAAGRGWEVEVEPGVPAAVRRGLAAAGVGRVLLAGSLFAVGEAMEALGGAPGEAL